MPNPLAESGRVTLIPLGPLRFSDIMSLRRNSPYEQDICRENLT